MDIQAIAENLTMGCRILAEQEILDAYGHLSARVPDRPELFVISRIMSPALVTPDDFIVMDFQGKVVEGNGVANQEWPIHACLYRARPDVQSVLHSHAMWSRVFSLSAAKLRGVLLQQTVDWFDGVPIYRDAGLIRTLERGDRVVETLGSGSAALLRGHGDVVVDGDITRTVIRAITLKQNAEVLHAVLQHGEPDYWTKDELAGWSELLAAGPDHLRGLANRAWEYYEARATGKLERLLRGEE